MTNQLPQNYRVSVKALIKDPEGRVLLVKESDDAWWGLPGGGMEHGETIQQALRREIQEELGVEVALADARPVAAWTFYCTYEDRTPPRHVLWIVYKVELASNPASTHDGHEAKYYAVEEVEPGVLADYFVPAYDEFIDLIRGN